MLTASSVDQLGLGPKPSSLAGPVAQGYCCDDGRHHLGQLWLVRQERRVVQCGCYGIDWRAAKLFCFFPLD